jgi:hypothetical protein
MSEDNKYNGWTNYATWRINLELFDGFEFDTIVTRDYLKELAEEWVFQDLRTQSHYNLVCDYAQAFLNDVNFYEIAEHINNEIVLELCEK